MLFRNLGLNVTMMLAQGEKTNKQKNPKRADSATPSYVFLRNIMGLKVVTIYLTFLSQGLCINLEWWDAEGDGRDFQKGWDIWLIHVEV